MLYFSIILLSYLSNFTNQILLFKHFTIVSKITSVIILILSLLGQNKI